MNRANRTSHRAFMPDKKKHNTKKATAITGRHSRTSRTDTLRPDRCPATWAYARHHGRPQRKHRRLLPALPRIEALLDDGYPGLSRDHRGQAITPPRKPHPGAPPGRAEQWERDRHRHSFDRITVEHALTDHKRRKQLMR
ncbi:mobile element protein [Streptomyces sp. L-9-10]|nr:mobile element protein [Streptomyces sp. L-9-10]